MRAEFLKHLKGRLGDDEDVVSKAIDSTPANEFGEGLGTLVTIRNLDLHHLHGLSS
jgi:hypothetical protein